MTTCAPPQLRVDLADWEGNTAFAKYDQFSVGDEDSAYTFFVSGYQNDSTAHLIETMIWLLLSQMDDKGYNACLVYTVLSTVHHMYNI